MGTKKPGLIEKKGKGDGWTNSKTKKTTKKNKGAEKAGLY